MQKTLQNTKLVYTLDMNCMTELLRHRSPSKNRFLLYCNLSLNGIFPAKSLTSLTSEPVISKICEIAQSQSHIIVSSMSWHFCLFSLFFFVLGRMLVVVFNPLCPVRFSLLLYCIYFCFSVPNKTISISMYVQYCATVWLIIPDIQHNRLYWMLRI